MEPGPGRSSSDRGWARAQARPWNDEGPEAAIRLVRGSSDFLGSASRTLLELGSNEVYSPALYPNATRIWDDAGFRQFRELTVMERALDQTLEEPDHRVGLARSPDWNALADVDRESFSGFWRMSALGLAEAMNATPRSALFQIDDEPGPIGYAIVGAQFTTSYLQRVAVVPTPRRAGTGHRSDPGLPALGPGPWSAIDGAQRPSGKRPGRPDLPARGASPTPGSPSACSGSRPELNRLLNCSHATRRPRPIPPRDAPRA